MKLSKGQWRMLIGEILEARNASEGYHAHIANQIEGLRQQLNTVLAKLEAIQAELERPSPVGPPYLPMPQGPPYYPVWTKTNTTAESEIDDANLPRRTQNSESMDWRTYEIMPDGTRRECAE